MPPAKPRKETADHVEPEEPTGAPRVPVLIAVFPRSIALEVPSPSVAVGRDWLSKNGIDDDEVSGEHLRFRRASVETQMQDVGSRNGTWIDGQPLPPREWVTLRNGCVIRIGRTLLVFRPSLIGSRVPAVPIGELVGPFGLRSVARSIEVLRRRRPRNVLIEGPTGTGKELLAAAIAQQLGRSPPFAPVNVAAIPATVIESQLFGHVAGAFSGASQAAPGIVAAHEGGTVFLDEIGELAFELQPKLLRLLENREVFPVGASGPTNVDVLFIAATNRSLSEQVEQGVFRQDLFARLLVARIQIQPLADRIEDLYDIATAVAPSVNAAVEPELVEVEALERLLLDLWPLNVRGLIATLGQIATVDPKPGLRLWAVDQVLGSLPETRPHVLTSSVVEAALAACGGNETRAAKRLGVSRGKLRRFLNKV